MESQFRLSSRVTRPAFPPLSTHQDPIFSAAPSSWDPRHLGSNLVPIPIRIVSVKPLRCLNSASDFNFMGVNEKHRPVIETTRKKLAVFVSGGGSNFRAIHEACFKGSVPGDVVVLVTNKKDCGGAEYARNHDIPVILFPKTKVESNGVSPVELVDVLKGYGVEFVLLVGFLKLIPAALVRAFPKCILNIHPSLLPAFGGKGFYGMKVHKAVLASGARYSGPTIHFVNEEYDTGRILAQRAVPVLADDTPEKLAARVLHEEHRLYVEVIGALCEGRIKWRDDGVPLIRSKENPNEYY